MAEGALPPAVGEPEMLVAGTVRRPHGVRGELQVAVDTDRPESVFRRGRALALGGKGGRPLGRSVTVERFRPVKDGGILQVRESASREAAEELRGMLLLIPVSEAAPAGEGEVLYRDLVGLEVIVAGERVGTVEEVLDLAGGEMLLVRRPGGKELLVPFVAEMVRRIDLDARRIEIVPPEGLLELSAPMRINIVTLFPGFFGEPLRLSIPGRAAAAGLVTYRVVDLRHFTHDRHQTVDDYPYGGGAGMVLKPEPFYEALESLAPAGETRPAGRIAVMSARGRRFVHQDAARLSLDEELTLLCGHYKDIDQRVADGLGAEEISLGDFVLSGGEVAALAVVDAVVRLLPGSISDHESASGDSHYDGLLSPPSYTRPAEYRGLRVPDVLLSGDHARIAEWRREQSERLTRERRPDLWASQEEGKG